MNDVLSGGREDGTCSDKSWHASNILGEPNFYPRYGDNKLGWEMSSDNNGDEFIELEFPFGKCSPFMVYDFKKSQIANDMIALFYIFVHFH